MSHTSYRQTSGLQAMWHVCRLSLLTLSLLSQAMGPAWAAPSQTPLINRPGNKAKPNVILTLDDSGSMTYQYAPERSFIKNGYTVDFPNDGKIYVHPREIRANIFAFADSRTATDDINHDTAFATGITNLATLSMVDQTYQVQLRSPDVNSIYYNPRILYQPWQRMAADGSIVRNAFSQADFSSAHLDPLWMDPLTRSSAHPRAVNLGNTTELFNVPWYCGLINGADANGNYSDCPVSEKPFNPALFYLLPSTGNPNVPGDYDAYNLNDGASSYTFPARYSARTEAGCTLGANNTVCTAAAEKQNFANWFVYYRSRLMIAKGALPDTFNAFSDNLRVGWGTIHAGTYTVDGQASNTVQQGVRNLDTSHKINFTNWLRGLGTQSGTPTRGAVAAVGEYFKRTDVGSPWRNDLTTLGTSTSAIQQSALSCRRAYNVVITDGYYRRDGVDPRANISNNVDNTAVPSGVNSLPAQYTPEFPFKDGASGTLADHAMKFWAEDLQPGIADQVAPIVVAPTNTTATSTPSAADVRLAEVKGNPATWQHLTQFFVGFGVTGLFTPNDATLRGLNNGRASSMARSVTYWEDTPNQIDDLWHAAINSRGAYFNVNNNEELKQALTTALALIDRSALKEAGLATASSTLSAGNFKYVPEYHVVSWVGDIKAYTLDANGTMGTTPIWSAKDELPDWENRNIFFWKSSAPSSNGNVNLDGGSAMPFRFSNLNTADQAIVSAPLVNYIRGKVEVGSGFRDRIETNADGTTQVNLLPDFVNSTPLYVKGALDLGYAALPGAPNATASAGYTDFLANKAARRNSALFIGGNSGMLHAFDAATGREKFAFLPRTGLPKLASIARADYGSAANYHQYLVDGQLVESDVYAALGTPSAAWHNIVVGTMGAGGKAVFALKLDASDPTNLDAGSVLWESTSEQSADMGYITTEPQVGVLPDGSWKVFVGNGVESASGKASLLVIDVATGAATSVDATTPADANAPRNGLGGVALVKNQLGQVIGAYAGDMQGNLWRFEYDSDRQSLVVGYGGSAVFRAYDSALGSAAPQPILAAPVVISHPQGGQVVVLNTGRLLYDQVGSTPGDAGSSQTQTVYGVWDHEAIDQLTLTKRPVFNLAPSDRNLLQQQSIMAVSALSTTTETFYDLSSNNVTWGNSSGGQGWLLDLKVPDSASATTTYSYPKAIYPPLKLGRSVLITAVKPGAVVESCGNTQATGFGFFIRALTGARFSRASIDANGNGTFDQGEASIGGFTYSGGGSQRMLTGTPFTDTDTNTPCTPGRAENANNGRNLRSCDDPNNTRTIKDRVWRQLLTPPAP